MGRRRILGQNVAHSLARPGQSAIVGNNKKSAEPNKKILMENALVDPFFHLQRATKVVAQHLLALSILGANFGQSGANAF